MDNNIWLTIKDENGILRPKAVLWPTGKLQTCYQPEINQYMQKAEKQGCKLVKVKIEEIK